MVVIPHDRCGERPKAFVTLKPGTEVSEQELIAFCRQRLANFKCPKATAFRPLPKTSTGKVQKFALREPEWGGPELGRTSFGRQVGDDASSDAEGLALVCEA